VKRAPVRHLVEYAGFLLVQGVVRSLPHRAARALGRAIGALGHRVLGRHRRIAADNMALALPEVGPEERARLVRACFEHFGMALTDALSAGRFDPEELCRRVDLVGWEHLQEAEEHADGRGVFVLSAHVGMWEIAAYPPGLYGGPLCVVGRPMDNPWLDRELTRSRARFGNRLIPKRGAVRRILKELGRGERVGILVDQRARPGEGIWVPFFGTPAYTSPVLARLSLRTGAPVVPIYGFPLPGGRYRVELAPAIRPEEATEGLGPDEAVEELTRRYLAEAEGTIRQHPEQWLWMHERWKDVDGGA
jgi:KDO2-lipid IV(A) lauroyltransferase